MTKARWRQRRHLARLAREARRARAEPAAARAAQYLDSLEERSVFPAREAIEALQILMQEPLPEGPSEANEILAQLDKVAGPATVASAGGRYFGFVTGAAMPATVAANWLATAWDQNSLTVSALRQSP